MRSIYSIYSRYSALTIMGWDTLHVADCGPQSPDPRRYGVSPFPATLFLPFLCRLLRHMYTVSNELLQHTILPVLLAGSQYGRPAICE